MYCLVSPKGKWAYTKSDDDGDDDEWQCVLMYVQEICNTLLAGATIGFRGFWRYDLSDGFRHISIITMELAAKMAFYSESAYHRKKKQKNYSSRHTCWFSMYRHYNKIALFKGYIRVYFFLFFSIC